jgi:hypothetical protein
MTSEKLTLKGLMDSYGLSKETLLYRSTLPEYLGEASQEEEFLLTANSDPSEAILSVYDDGHIWLATDMGPGLAFAESEDHEWHDSTRVNVVLRLQDALDQGGLIYPVESVITERVWYLTMPAGKVKVRKQYRSY